jgi:hypothetical protein
MDISLSFHFTVRRSCFAKCFSEMVSNSPVDLLHQHSHSLSRHNHTHAG